MIRLFYVHVFNLINLFRIPTLETAKLGNGYYVSEPQNYKIPTSR